MRIFFVADLLVILFVTMLDTVFFGDRGNECIINLSELIMVKS